MNKIKLYSIIFFYIFIINNIFSQEEIIPEKVVFIKNSTEEQFAVILNQIFSDVLDNISSQDKIVFINEYNWKDNSEIITNYKHALRKDTASLYLHKNIRRLISFDYDDKNINLTIYNVTENKNYKFKIERHQSDLLSEIKHYKKEFSIIIEENIHGITKKQQRQDYIKQLGFFRQISNYKIVFGGSLGYNFHANMNNDKISLYGFNFSSFSEFTIHKFVLGVSTSYDQVFAPEGMLKDEFSNLFFLKLDFGGLLYSDIFALSLGIGYLGGIVYGSLIIYPDTGGEYISDTEFQKAEFNGTLLYLRFRIIPLSKFYVGFDIGYIIFPGQFERLRPTIYFPVYLNFDMRFYIKDNLALFVNVPLYTISIMNPDDGNEDDGGEMTFMQGLSVGVSYRIKWDKKNE